METSPVAQWAKTLCLPCHKLIICTVFLSSLAEILLLHSDLSSIRHSGGDDSTCAQSQLIRAMSGVLSMVFRLTLHCLAG